MISYLCKHSFCFAGYNDPDNLKDFANKTSILSNKKLLDILVLDTSIFVPASTKQIKKDF